MLEAQGRWVEAEDLFRTSLAEREAMARANPDVPQYLLFRGSGRRSLADFYRKREALQGGRGPHSPGCRRFRHPGPRPPWSARVRLPRGEHPQQPGMDPHGSGRYPEAEAQARASTEALRRLWDSHPTVLVYGDNLGNGFNDLARILRRTGTF